MPAQNCSLSTTGDIPVFAVLSDVAARVSSDSWLRVARSCGRGRSEIPLAVFLATRRLRYRKIKRVRLALTPNPGGMKSRGFFLCNAGTGYAVLSDIAAPSSVDGTNAGGHGLRSGFPLRPLALTTVILAASLTSPLRIHIFPTRVALVFPQAKGGHPSQTTLLGPVRTAIRPVV